MLDLKFVRDHLSEVEQAMQNRGMAIPLDKFHLHDGERRRMLTKVEELRHQRNTLSQEVGGLMKEGKQEAIPLSSIFDEIVRKVKGGSP